MNLHEKIQAVQDACQVVDKEGKNKFQGYAYVMLGTILNDINPLLVDNNLIITQSVEDSKCELSFIDDGAAYYSHAHVVVKTTVFDSESGDSLTVNSSGFAADKNGDKALFKAITGARKYGLTMMFKLHTDSVEPESDQPALSAKSSRKNTTSKAPANSNFF